MWVHNPKNEWRLHNSKVKACEHAILLKHLEGIKGKVLEIGPGNNKRPRQTLEGRAEWTGVDAVWRDNPENRCFRGRAHKLPFEDRSFDWVLAFSTIEHWNERRTAIRDGLREVVRVLKFGGKFLACVPMFNHGSDAFFLGRRGQVEDEFRKVLWSDIEFEDWSRDPSPLPKLTEWKNQPRAKEVVLEVGGYEPHTYTVEVFATK